MKTSSLLRVLALLMLLLVRCGYITDLGTPVELTKTVLQGWVKDSLTLRPISGATVTVSGGSVLSVTTDSTGYFEFPSLYTGGKTLSIQAGSYKQWQGTVSVEKELNRLIPRLISRENHPPRIVSVLYPSNNQLKMPLLFSFNLICSDSDFLVQTSVESLSYILRLDTLHVMEVQYAGKITGISGAASNTIRLPSPLISNLKAGRKYYWQLTLVDLLGRISNAVSDSFTTRSFGEDPTACPSRMIRVEAESHSFCMDKYEVTNEEYRIFDSAMTYWYPNPGDSIYQKYEYSSFSGSPNGPAANVPLILADSFCSIFRSRGGRLCTMDEWKTACGGWSVWSFPYADQYDPSKCNTEKSALLSVAYGGGPDTAGKWVDCVSQFGIYDLSGNVDEWVYLSENTKFRQSVLNSQKVFFHMGGNWASRDHSGINSNDSILTLDKFYRQADIGFRCCRN